MVVSRSERPIDIIIYGASAFTGLLVLEHLAHSSTQCRWIIGGRSREKLRLAALQTGVADTIRKHGEGVADVEEGIIIADSTDEDALRRMCSKAKVIATLAGPYDRYGSLLVGVCADVGTHYLDLTGESGWVERQIRLHERRSLETGAILLFSAGLDSLPPDLCTYMCAQALEQEAKKHPNSPSPREWTPAKTRTVWIFLGGWFSGGTWNTIMDATRKPAETLRLARTPYALSPVIGRQKPWPIFVGREEGRWGGLWILSSHNSQVVRRTWGLLQNASAQSGYADSEPVYGDAFNYDEYMGLPDPISSIFVSLLAYFVVGVCSIFPPARWLVSLPFQQSSGPSRANRDRSRMTCITTMHTLSNSHIARTTMRGKGDGGYKCTAIMFAEAALGLVENADILDKRPFAQKGGPLTPATVFGAEILKTRLEKTGIFDFETVVYKRGQRPMAPRGPIGGDNAVKRD